MVDCSRFEACSMVTVDITEIIYARDLLHRCPFSRVCGVVKEIDTDIRIGDRRTCPDTGIDHARLLVINRNEDCDTAGGRLARRYGMTPVGIERPQKVIGVTHELNHPECGDNYQEKREHSREQTPGRPGEYEVQIPEENDSEQHHERGSKERNTCCHLHGRSTVVPRRHHTGTPRGCGTIDLVNEARLHATECEAVQNVTLPAYIMLPNMVVPPPR